MLPDNKVRCPATGFAKTCRSIVTKYECPKFVKISGVNPNDGNPVDRFGCVDTFLPMLLIENSQQQRQTGASCDKVANEVAKFHENMARANLVTANLIARKTQELICVEEKQ